MFLGYLQIHEKFTKKKQFHKSTKQNPTQEFNIG